MEGLTKFLETGGDYGRAAPEEVMYFMTFTNCSFPLFTTLRLSNITAPEP